MRGNFFMNEISSTDELFFTRAGLDRARVQNIVDNSLLKTDDGELFLEYTQTEEIVFDDGQIKSAAFDTSQGFGLRAISGEITGYSQSSEISEPAIERAGNTVKSVCIGKGKNFPSPPKTNKNLYQEDNPLNMVEFEIKVDLMTKIDAYARSQDERVAQVTASLSGNWQAVEIIRAGGETASDIRPLVRLNISIVVEKSGRMEAGSYGIGGRVTYDQFFEEKAWKAAVDEAIRQATINLESIPAPAGEMPVVLGSGWPGILLHEAIGHGLEGDFNRKKTSAFSGLLGQQIAARGVTVVDDGTIENRRGSLTIDDEGTPSENTVLIEDGILVGYMQDRMNARLMGTNCTGNGRRESYAHAPIPRMTNTYMLSGDKDPAEIIQSTKNGIYAVSFGGGQVDITSGKFVFSCTEAYLIENGKIGPPVKGATLIGNGPDVLTRVSMIGNDLQMDPGIGTCGKDGQGVPVGVGQPTLKIENLTVGGTEV